MSVITDLIIDILLVIISGIIGFCIGVLVTDKNYGEPRFPME